VEEDEEVCKNAKREQGYGNADGGHMDDEMPEDPRIEDDAEDEDEEDEEGVEEDEEVCKNANREQRYANPYLGHRDDEMPEDPRIATYGYFCLIWDHHWKTKLVVRKWLPFAKCDKCIDIRNRCSATRDAALKETLNAELRAHLQFVKRERAAYAAKRLLGRYQGDKYLSLIIDGADQSDHQLPHVAQQSHSTSESWKLKLHLLGVLVHGKGAYVYTCPAHIAQGNNVTIQALWDTIVKIRETDGKLPGVLFLQLDNTTKSCKGRWLMAFLALLVEYGVFERVLLSFLPVGHTHEDIDQFFSCIARVLRRYNALSRHGLEKCIIQSFQKWGTVPIVTHWTTVGNISGWMELDDKVPKQPQITCYAQFRFFRSTTGTVWMQARRWPGGGDDDHWSGLKGNDTHQQIWKNNQPPDLLRDYANVPDAARSQAGGPSPKTKQKIRAGLDKCYKYLSMNDAHKADCEALFELYCTPVGTRMPFAWKKTDIEKLLQPTQFNNEDNVPTARKHAEPAVTKGLFFLMRSPDDDSSLMYISEVMRVDKATDGTRMVHCRDWVLSKRGGKQQDAVTAVTGTYVPDRGQGTVWRPRQEHSGCFQTQLRVKMKKMKKGSQVRLSLTICKDNQSLAKYYYFRYTGSPDSTLHESETVHLEGSKFQGVVGEPVKPRKTPQLTDAAKMVAAQKRAATLERNGSAKISRCCPCRTTNNGTCSSCVCAKAKRACSNCLCSEKQTCKNKGDQQDATKEDRSKRKTQITQHETQKTQNKGDQNKKQKTTHTVQQQKQESATNSKCKQKNVGELIDVPTFKNHEKIAITAMDSSSQRVLAGTCVHVSSCPSKNLRGPSDSPLGTLHC
jgi:hypothetical protein